MSDTIIKINKTIYELFNPYHGKELMPWFYADEQFIEWAPILFVWMNPAWDLWKIQKWWITDKQIWEILKNHNSAINWNQEKEWKLYKYYKAFEDLVPTKEKSKRQWNAIDLFVDRSTNQKILENYVFSEEWSEFYKKQYETVFLPLIRHLEPKIIVIANAAASRYITNRWIWDEAYFSISDSWYWEIPDFINTNKKSIPTIFTSMLSWQRALDKWSRAMLLWNINRLIRHK